MSKMYERTLMVLTNEQLNNLFSKKVIVFGLGGVGCSVVDSLIRSGIKEIGIVDSDFYNETNLNRQLFSNINTIGLSKVKVTKDYIKSINPEIIVHEYDMFYNIDSSSEIDLSYYDYVIDCIDSVTSKVLLIKNCMEKNIKIISSLGTGNKLDPTKVTITDISKTYNDSLARVLRKELKDLGINHLNVCYSTDIGSNNTILDNGRHIPGSTYFVPNVAGIYIGYFVLKDLIGE